MNSRSLKSKPFKFKKIYPPGSEPFSRKPVVATDGAEILTGYFQAKPAKRDEEFFMTEAVKNPNVLGVEFRMALGAPKGMPGWLELDALIQTHSGFRAFEIDDMSFIHLGQRESAESVIKDTRRIQGLRQKGIQVREIEHLDAKNLDTREKTKKEIQRISL